MLLGLKLCLANKFQWCKDGFGCKATVRPSAYYLPTLTDKFVEEIVRAVLPIRLASSLARALLRRDPLTLVVS
jgi:hypothetical protein